MQNDLFSDLTQILPHLARLDQKIQTLRWLGKNLDDSRVEIFATFRDGSAYPIDQELIPFKLEMELKTLVEDSIDEYQRQHDHLKKLFDDTNN
jgi:hypothetical protein